MKARLLASLLCVQTTIVLTGCIKLDFLLFDDDQKELEDYDFTSDDLDGIDPSRITSELIPVGDTGERIHIVYIERDESKLDPRLDPDLNLTVLYSHGNLGSNALYWHRGAYLEDMGFNVLLVDYRGYGASDGDETSEGATYQDVGAAYDYLRGRDDVGEILSYGFSMGGGPAIWLCSPESEREVLACITESVWTSTEDIINGGCGYDFVGEWFIDAEYNNEERVHTVEVPFMRMHGVLDWRVPVGHGDVLWSILEGKDPLNRYYRIEKAGHRNVAIPSYTAEWLPVEYSHPDEMPEDLHADFEVYKERIADFVVDVIK